LNAPAPPVSKVSDRACTLAETLTVPKTALPKTASAVAEFGNVAGFQFPAVFQSLLATAPVQVKVWAAASVARSAANGSDNSAALAR